MSISRFSTFLINSPFGDAGLIINFINKKRALLFDLGDVSALSERQLLNITHIFITHTHIDHFFGFDRIFRLFLGKNKSLYLYGPPGLFKNVEGKISGYHWNMLNNYKSNLSIHVIEVDRDYISTKTYESSKNFRTTEIKTLFIKNGLILSEEYFEVIVEILDHGIPCLAFSLQESPIVNLRSDKLKSEGLIPGKWIKTLKKYLHKGLYNSKQLELVNKKSCILRFSISDLQKMFKVSSGQKITYITDVNFTKNNLKPILKLAYKSTQLFIEAVFLTKHEEMAMAKYHLTAKQSGQIARMSKSKEYTLFHHSRRYIKCPEYFKEEAEEEFQKKYKN